MAKIIVLGAKLNNDQKELSNPKVLVTPHIAFSTKQAIANGAEIAVENIESFIKGKPQNILTKK